MQTFINGGMNNYEKLFAGAKVDAITEVYVASLLVGKQREVNVFLILQEITQNMQCFLSHKVLWYSIGIC